VLVVMGLLDPNRAWSLSHIPVLRDQARLVRFCPPIAIRTIVNRNGRRRRLDCP
jgi:hypothetical protein